jgi:GAF domain-containing protein
MTFRTRTLFLVTLLLASAVLVLGAVLIWNSYHSLLSQQTADGYLLAHLLARTTAIVNEFPQEMEDATGEQMIVAATISAHFVDVAEKAGLSPEEINTRLRNIVDKTALSEFWITDEYGHAYLRNITEIDFTFSPDPQKQPQASAFYPLLTGQAQVVVQEARVREVDDNIFKYVGVSGVDKPRIVQVGYNYAVLAELRQRVSLERLVEQLVSAGDVSAIRFTDSHRTTLVFSGVPGLEADQLSPTDLKNLDEVIRFNRPVSYLEDGLLKVIVPVYKLNNEQIIGAIMVYLPTDQLQALIQQQITRGILVALSVLAAGMLMSIILSHRVTDPIQQVAQAAMAVETSTYHPKLLKHVVRRTDEVGQLGRIFDRMAREVLARDRRLALLRTVIPAGVRLSAERDFNRLLETIVVEAQQVTNADAGSLYLVKDQELEFVIVRNTSLGLTMGGTSNNPVTLPKIRLYDKNGAPNYRNVATYAALCRQRVTVDDAYAAEGFDFSGTRTFDQQTGYHSKSFMTLPLEGEDEQVIGVLQLINARERETGKIVPFVADDVIDSLVLLASAALAGYIREQSLRAEIEQLRIVIDEPKREREVAEITETDYFRKLQDKAQEIRRKRGKG